MPSRASVVTRTSSLNSRHEARQTCCSWSPERLATTYEEHGKLLRAILARKEDDAIQSLRAHIESSKAEIRQITLHKLALVAGTGEVTPTERGRRNAV